MSEHTPTPWRVLIQTGFNPLLLDDNDKIVGEIHSPAAANWVMRAVNAHDALVEALTAIIAKFESDPDDLETMDAGIKIARAALKLAKGETL